LHYNAIYFTVDYQLQCGEELVTMITVCVYLAYNGKACKYNTRQRLYIIIHTDFRKYVKWFVLCTIIILLFLLRRSKVEEGGDGVGGWMRTGVVAKCTI